MQLFWYKNISHIASKTCTTQCIFTDHLNHKTVNKAICRMPSATVIENACNQMAFVVLKANTKFYSRAQTAICFLERNKNCTQTDIRFFKAKYKILKTIPTRPSAIPNDHSLFDYEIRNCKVVPNSYSFFDNEIQNLELYSNDHSFFDCKQQK